MPVESVPGDTEIYNEWMIGSDDSNETTKIEWIRVNSEVGQEACCAPNFCKIIPKLLFSGDNVFCKYLQHVASLAMRQDLRRAINIVLSKLSRS